MKPEKKLIDIIRHISGHSYDDTWYKSDEEARAAILELVRGTVPEEVVTLETYNPKIHGGTSLRMSDNQNYFNSGINQYRKEILDRLEGL